MRLRHHLRFGAGGILESQAADAGTPTMLAGESAVRCSVSIRVSWHLLHNSLLIGR